MDDDFSDRFWRRVCDFEGLFPGLLMLSTTLLVVMVALVFTLEPGSANHVIAVADVGLMAVVSAVTLAMIVGCRRQKKDPYRDVENERSP